MSDFNTTITIVAAAICLIVITITIGFYENLKANHRFECIENNKHRTASEVMLICDKHKNYNHY